MNLESIAERIEAQSVATRGRDLFLNLMPGEIPVGLLLKEPFGGTEIDHELPGYRKASFQIISRSEDYAEAKELIEQAVEALTMVDTALTDMQVHYMRPRHEPFTFPLTVGNRLEFLVNMDLCYVITA